MKKSICARLMFEGANRNGGRNGMTRIQMPRIRWLLIYAVLTFIAAVNAAAFFKEIGRIERMSDALESRMDEYAGIMRKNQELEMENEFYATREGVIEAARRFFNLAMPGEKMYRIEIVSNDASGGQGRDSVPPGQTP
ncbi:MAG: hypothetical protein LBS53_07280 [Synergistaceae bacterium]|nr:hypothetical protein [Synergistaceae bacterium]